MNKAFERPTSFLKVLLLTIYLNCNAKAAAKPTKKMVYPGDDYFQNMPPRQEGTRGVRHLFYTLKVCRNLRTFVEKVNGRIV